MSDILFLSEITMFAQAVIQLEIKLAPGGGEEGGEQVARQYPASWWIFPTYLFVLLSSAGAPAAITFWQTATDKIEDFYFLRSVVCPTTH